jgi:hypothetical protein
MNPVFIAAGTYRQACYVAERMGWDGNPHSWAYASDPYRLRGYRKATLIQSHTAREHPQFFAILDTAKAQDFNIVHESSWPGMEWGTERKQPNEDGS